MTSCRCTAVAKDGRGGHGRPQPADGPDRTPGELWAEAELTRLRSERFRPRAWTGFLHASLARAAQTRRVRPELGRQVLRWCATGCAATLSVRYALARRGLPVPRPGRVFARSAAITAMLRWHLGMVEGAGGEPRRGLSSADAVTLARLWSAPLVAATESPLALVAGAISDVVDGRLARRAGGTRLGRDLDPVADIAFFGAAARAEARVGRLGRPAAVALVVRHAAMVAVTATGYFATGRRLRVELVGPTRWSGPPLALGLTLARLGRRRAATALVIASAVGPLATAVLWRTPPTAAS